MTTIALNSTIARSSSIITTDVEDGVIMLSIDAGKYYGATDVAYRIWQLLETPITVTGICDVLINEYEVERERCERQVMSFLEEMLGEGVITIVEQ